MLPIKPQVRSAFRKDGVDHINVSAYADTELGKLTSTDWRKTFLVPHIGVFATPRSFANWMVSGGVEELRHSTSFYRTNAPVADFRLLLLFGKYYQLCSMRSNLMPLQKLINLPWVMYKKHMSGVREFDRWEVYAFEVKEMVKYVIANGSKSHYPWADTVPQVSSCFDHYLEMITGDEFIPFDELNRIAKEKASQRSASDKAKAEANQAQTQAAPSNDEEPVEEDLQPPVNPGKPKKPTTEYDLQKQFHLQQVVEPAQELDGTTPASV